MWSIGQNDELQSIVGVPLAGKFVESEVWNAKNWQIKKDQEITRSSKVDCLIKGFQAKHLDA